MPSDFHWQLFETARGVVVCNMGVELRIVGGAGRGNELGENLLFLSLTVWPAVRGGREMRVQGQPSFL